MFHTEYSAFIVKRCLQFGYELTPKLIEYSKQIKDTPDVDVELTCKYPLRPYQVESVKRMIPKKYGVLLADDMGLGKTLQAIAVVTERKEYPVVIICPSHLKDVWKCEFNKWAPDVSLTTLKGQKAKPIDRDAQVVIINYEILKFWSDELTALDPKIIILDEAHRCKSKDAQCTVNAKILTDDRYTMLLTGTPLTKNAMDVYTLVSMINPHLLGNSTTFKENFVEVETVQYWMTVPGGQRKLMKREKEGGCKNVQDLHELLTRTVMIRRRKEDVLPELPAKTRNMVHVSINTAEYKKLKAEAKKEGKDGFGALYKMLGMGKVKHAIEWITDYLAETDEKLIVMVWHRDVAEALHKAFKDESVLIYGGKSTDVKKTLLDEWRTKKQLLIGNMKSIGEGLTLVESSTILFVELPLTDMSRAQAEDRICRIGQTQVCMYYYLIAMETLEDRIMDLITRKHDDLSKLADGKTSENVFRQALEDE
jgi:SWI/SNF-related matrix-associated actin-dependent regulator 1 of chromatin subfamily A